MRENQCFAALGGLLHDIGKAVCRSGDGRGHPESGFAFLQEASVTEEAVLQQARYHHAEDLREAALPPDSLAYVAYMANRIASAADRRETEPPETGGSRTLPLASLFNRLNGGGGHGAYSPGLLDEAVRFPAEETVSADPDFYRRSLETVRGALRGLRPDDASVAALLELLENQFTYVPASCTEDAADVSLFDHCRMTAALGCCILDYLGDGRDYRAALWENEAAFLAEKAFLLYSMDLSGIQDFIYTIASDGALKALRARSFYLELLMEHLVDTLLTAAGLSRANCVYTGGGHAYLLLPNTEAARACVDRFEADANEWLLQTFGAGLFLSGGGAACSANDLRNEPDGSYREIFRAISNRVSSRKLRRYSAEQLLALQAAGRRSGLRECAVCRRTDQLSDGQKCAVCEGLEAFSRALQTRPFFAATATKPEGAALPLPGNAFLTAESADGLARRAEQDPGFLRGYAKNVPYAGRQAASRLWVGDYQNGGSFSELAQSAEGVGRLAVLRADVDNLGQAFVRGFESETAGRRYVTLSRTAAFSRSLSLFFKRHINAVLENGRYFLTERDPSRRAATIVYSGGDDVFVIGAWDDIVGFAVDLYRDLSRFSQNTLTISAGIGLFPEKYPVSSMARQTGSLEERSKARPGKNAVTLFDRDNSYGWQEFIDGVLGEKYALLRGFFTSAPDYGKAFLYRLLELLRGRGDKLNLARYAYLLTRMEPNEKAPDEQRARYREFSRKMYEWIQDGEQCRQTITAIYIYLYTIREGGNADGTERSELRG